MGQIHWKSLEVVVKLRLFDALRSTDENAKRILNEFQEIDGLEEIVNGIFEMGDSEIYEKFYQAFKLEEKIWDDGTELTESEKKNQRLIQLAYKNLSKPTLRVPPLVDLIDFLSFYVMYRILEDIYYVNIGKRMSKDYKIELYFTGLDERIIFALEKFDTIKHTPSITLEFFQKIKKVDWKDKKTKKLNSKLHALSSDYFIEKRRTLDSKFTETEYAFLLYLSGCSAVNDNRDKIEEKDVIRAYRTYFKLLNTDITKLV